MIELLGNPKRLLVACDFDGTLAPLVDDPDQAQPLPGAVAALRLLAGLPDTVVAIISGRRRSELIERFGEEGFLLVGEHGADDGDLSGAEPPSLARARRLVEDTTAGLPGSRAEHKLGSVVFHYRTAENPGPAVDRLRRQLAGLEGVTVLEGKAVVEASVTGTDKGEAISRIREELEVDAVVFLGDDTTDEAVFSRLRPNDLGVKVGPGPTRASRRLPDPPAVADFLAELVRWRRGG